MTFPVVEHPHAQVRFFFLVPLVAFALVLGSLYATDRVLRRSDAATADADARLSAATLESFMAARVERLVVFRAAVASGELSGTEPNVAGPLRLLSGRLTDFQHIWLADPAGVIVADTAIADLGAHPTVGSDIDTMRLMAIGETGRRARQSHRPQLSHFSRSPTGGYIATIIDPVVVDTSLRGFVGASVVVDSALYAIGQPSVIGQRIVHVIAGADTLALGDTGRLGWGHATEAARRISLSLGSDWQLQVTRRATSDAVRVLLWGLALSALGAMMFSVVAERRQARRLAERSVELERLSAEVLQANRAKSEFLANVSHELRTPLNAIVGFVDLLRDGGYGPLAPNQVGPVARVAASATHLRVLVDQVLDLARITAGRLEIHLDVLQLRPFVLNVVAEIESLLTERDLGVSVSISTTLPRVRTDPIHFRQILLNLLGNAIKFTQEGSIAVRARVFRNSSSPWLEESSRQSPGGQPGAWLALQIVDTGVGIPDADLERIFGEFEQVNAGPRGNSSQRGTGLGLAISRRLARLLGGDITVESRVSEGSTFTLWLPIDSDELAAAQDRRRLMVRDPKATTA